jgi:hypothetical protein
LLLALLLLREWRTQVIILTATNYSLPAPLNPWAVEDGNKLKDLEKENLTPVTDISDKWNLDPTLTTLHALLDDTIETTKAPLIVYISMHGVVDDERVPCFLPPGEGPNDTTKLIPVRRVLERISQRIEDRRKTLVILDCSRFRANWPLGIVYNTFTARLQEDLEKNPVANVTVLCSAGPGQVNWASAELQGSSFGRYLQLGLAGAADSGEGADGKGAVTLHELVAYLEREVNSWSEFSRGEPQKPTLVSRDVEDFHLAYNVRDSDTLAELESNFYSQKQQEPEKRSEIAALWAQLDELREQGLVRQDPVACRDFELGLLRLEGLWQGGSAYRQTAEDELSRLKSQFSRVVEQKTAAAGSRYVADHLGLGTIRVTAHTLPMAEYFGACDSQLSERIGQLWNAPAQLAGGNTAPQSAAGEREQEIARGLAEMKLLESARDQGVASLWPSPAPLASALALRTRAEQLAVPRDAKGLPGDERAHYFARYALDAADEKRRLVEDVLFIGPRSGEDFASLEAEAAELYGSASEVMQGATAAYAIRDAALAESPYLGWWLCGPLKLEVPERKALINELVELIRQSSALDQAITSPESFKEAGASPGSGDLPFEHLTSAALKHHQALKDAFKRKCEDLLGAGSQGTAGWTALDSALMTPLVPADQRGVLLKKRDEVSEQLFTRYAETKQAAHDAPADDNEERPDADDDEGAPYLKAMHDWDAHPLVEILLDENSETAKQDLDWCDDVARRLRRRLTRLPSDEDDEAGATDLADDDIFGDRQRLSRVESALRASASLGFDVGGLKTDPIVALREFDVRELLVWQSKRVMGDFWGDASVVDGPFFVRAATHYLDAARNLGTSTAAFDQRVSKLQDTLADLENAKRQSLDLTAVPRLVNVLEGNVAVQLQVAANASTYPAGRGSVYLRDQSRQRFEIQFEDAGAQSGDYVAYPPAGASQNFSMTVLRAPSDAARAEAVSFFRGQEYTDPFEMPTFKGVRVEYEPYVYDSQSITLYGDDPEQMSLVFILDCSHSMDAMTRVRAEGADMQQRLLLAKEGLNSMLSDIASRNSAGEDTHVGVRFYGHRLAWSRPDTNPPPAGWSAKLVIQKGYKGRKPEKPTPAEDVELVQPLGEFDGGVASDIATLLASVEPHGETPLYLSLLQALDDFKSVNVKTRNSIIAITDGQDYQFPHPNFPPPRKITRETLRAEWERRPLKVPIHILGFDIDASEAATARMEYKEVARFTGGSFEEIRSGRELLDHLREHLQVDGYTVSALPLAAANRGTPEPVKLDTPVEVSSSPQPRDFQVQFRDVKKPVRIEGGEAIALYVEKNASFHRIVARDYNERSPLPDKKYLVAGDGGSPTEYILRAHRPVRRQGSENVVEFPVSLQHDPRESHFTRRPAEAWLEITPLSESGSGRTVEHQPYVFYDTNFEPAEPVPVLVCPAVEWQGWPKARIRFWCKDRVTKPALEIGLRESKYRTPQPVPETSGIQLRVETFESGDLFRVYVVENHGPESPGVDNGLRIGFQTHPQCKPVHVRHQFDKDKGLATHTFDFRASDSETIKDDAGSRIVVTLAADIKDGAWQLAADSPLELSVQAAGGFHTTGGASSGQ